MSQDPDLQRLLPRWQPPEPPAAMDYRVLASYRQHLLQVPLCRRLWTARIAVPLPLAAALLLAAVGLMFWLHVPERGVPRQNPALVMGAGSPCAPAPVRPPSASSMLVRTRTGTGYSTTIDDEGWQPVTDAHPVIRKARQDQ